jgi:cell division protein FtsB
MATKETKNGFDQLNEAIAEAKRKYDALPTEEQKKWREAEKDLQKRIDETAYY